MDTVINYYIIAACLLTWLGITAYGIHLVRSKWHVLKFKPVEATITGFSKQEVAAVSDYDFSDFGTVDIILMVSYKFEIDGEYFFNKQDFARGSFEKDKTTSEPLYNGKKLGEQITVYYNPDKPGENYLHRNFVLGGILTVCFGQLFLLLTIHLVNKWLCH